MKTLDVDFFLFSDILLFETHLFSFHVSSITKTLTDTEDVVMPQEKSMILTMIDRFSYKSLSNFILQLLVQ